MIYSIPIIVDVNAYVEASSLEEALKKAKEENITDRNVVLSKLDSEEYNIEYSKLPTGLTYVWEYSDDYKSSRLLRVNVETGKEIKAI